MTAPLPTWELPVTPTLVVSTAIATRDFQDVHHDRDLAQGHGSRDIFLNILTTTGLVQRYVGEWARVAVGPDFRITGCGLRLGAPAYPGDTLSFSGTVTDDAGGAVVVAVEATVRPTSGTINGDHRQPLPRHVNATVTVAR
ncbi:MAG: MaoC/PaaZ C-terminal domain-containing protein [Marmoricola sp.]